MHQRHVQIVEGDIAMKLRNRRIELSALLKSLPAGSRIGMESTGS